METETLTYGSLRAKRCYREVYKLHSLNNAIPNENTLTNDEISNYINTNLTQEQYEKYQNKIGLKEFNLKSNKGNDNFWAFSMADAENYVKTYYSWIKQYRITTTQKEDIC